MDLHKYTAGTIVVGLDGLEDGQFAIDWACAQAGLDHRVLVVAHAEGRTLVARPPEEPDFRGLRLSRHPNRTDTALLDARDLVSLIAPGLDVRVMVLHNGAIHGLVETSQSAAMLVLGVPGWRVEAPSLFRSVAVSVVKGALCPVVVVRRAPHLSPESVLVGTDCMAKSDPALDFAFRTAASRSWPLTVLHSFWDRSRDTGDVPDDQTGYAEKRSTLAEAVRPHWEHYPEVKVEFLLSRGFADQRLIQASRDHGLVVLGHCPQPMLKEVVWGNVTSSVLRHATGNVAVVPAHGQRPAVTG